MVRRVVRLYVQSFSGLPRAVWWLSGVAMINRSGTMVQAFMVLYLTSQRGWSPAAAGSILSLYGLGAIGAGLLGGWLSDRLGPRLVQVLTLLANGAGFLVLPHLGSRAALGTAMLLIGLTAEAFRPANASVLAESSPPHLRTKAFALNRLAVNLGMSVGAVAGGFLARQDYLLLFLADGGTCLLAGLLLLRVAPPRLDAVRAAPAGRLRTPRAGRSPWRDAPFVTLLLLNLGVMLVFFQMFGSWPLYLRGPYGFLEPEIGLLIGVNTILIVVFEMVLVHLVRNRDTLRAVGLGSFLLCVGFGLIGFGSGWPWAALTVVVWTTGEMLALPLLGGFVASRADDRNRGRYMGAWLTSFAVAFAVAPALGTYVYESLGPGTLWTACLAVGLLALLGYWRLASWTGPASEPAGRPIAPEPAAPGGGTAPRPDQARPGP